MLLLRFSVGAFLVWFSNERFQSLAGRLLHVYSLIIFFYDNIKDIGRYRISGPFSFNKHSYEIHEKSSIRR